MLLRILLLMIGVAATSCTNEPAPAAPENAATRTEAFGLPLGRTFVYALAWTVDAGFDGSDSPAGLPLAGGLDLQGELHVQAIGQREGGTLAAIWFDGLTVREITVNGERIEIDPGTLTGPRAYFVISPGGDVPQTWFEPGSPSLFRHVMGGALARFDLRGASAGSTPQVVPTGHGLAEVGYTRTGAPGGYRRDLQRMVRFDAIAGIDADRPAVEGVLELDLDADRIPLRIEGRQDVELADRGWTFGSHERFRVERMRVDDGAQLPDPGDLTDHVELDPAAIPDPSEAERQLAQRFADGLAIQDVGIAVTAMDGGLLPGRGFVSQATGLLRGWPDTAEAMIPIALGASGHGRQLAFDLLASAGTPEAQAVMRTLLERDDVRRWPELPLLIGRFGFVHRPTTETAQFVLALHTEAREGGDATLAHAILYPLGSVAGAIERTEPWLAELLHARLVEELTRARDPDSTLAAMAGLGNVGRLGDRRLLLPFVTDPDDAVRANAITALRSMVAADSTAALVAALRDVDSGVARNALDVLARHHYEDSPEQSAALAEIVIAGRVNPEIETAVVNALSTRIDDDPSVRIALRDLAARTQDREIAARIAALLAA